MRSSSSFIVLLSVLALSCSAKKLIHKNKLSSENLTKAYQSSLTAFIEYLKDKDIPIEFNKISVEKSLVPPVYLTNENASVNIKLVNPDGTRNPPKVEKKEYYPPFFGSLYYDVQKVNTDMICPIGVANYEGQNLSIQMTPLYYQDSIYHLQIHTQVYSETFKDVGKYYFVKIDNLKDSIGKPLILDEIEINFDK